MTTEGSRSMSNHASDNNSSSVGFGAHVRRTIVVVAAGALTACATQGRWFQPGPRPAALVGIWIDSSQSTPTDTVAWVLAANGDDRTLRVHVQYDGDRAGGSTQEVRRYASWYLEGTLGDTSSQAFCVKRRPRDGGSCSQFRLDTLYAPDGGIARRRLVIRGYVGERHTRDRVLLERR